jgi:hypothetical protein
MELFATDETKDIARTPSTMDIIAQVSAMPSDAGDRVALMEKLIAMKYADEDRQARLLFEEHFAQMQAVLPVVTKRKENGGSKSKYAPIEDIQAQWDPIIRSHGFSYSWREEVVPEFDGKRILLDVMGYGHTKTNYFDSPRIDGNSAQNKIQVAGAMSTYGRRYTFVSGMGGRVEGEDSDGQTLDEGSLEIDLRTFLHSGKLSPEATKIILDELAKPDKDIAKLRNYWKRAKAKVEK